MYYLITANQQFTILETKGGKVKGTFSVLFCSFGFFALALSGCAFEDEGVVALEGGQCSTKTGTISVVPNDKEKSSFRVDAYCTDIQVRANICPVPWQDLGIGKAIEQVCFNDNALAVVSISLPTGGEIISSEEVDFEIYLYKSDPEMAFEESYVIEKGKILTPSEPTIVRIRTLPRRSD